MEPVKNLALLIEELSSTSTTSENDDQWLLKDIWGRILVFLDTKGIRNFSLISKKICIVVLGSPLYVWHVYNKPKLCKVLTLLTVSVNERHCDALSVINNCIKTLLRTGYTHSAKETALRSKEDFDKIKLLLDTVVQYQIQEGNIEEAKKTLIEAKNKVVLISSKDTKDLLLINIVKVMAKVGDIDNAVDTIQHIYFKYHQAKACMYVAQSRAQTEDIGNAIKGMEQSIREIASLGYECNRAILREIDVFLLKMCGRQNINKIAQDISEKYNRSTILFRFQIEELVQNNRKDDARKSLIEEKDRLFRGESTRKIDELKNVAAIQFEIGDSDQGKDTLEKIKDIALKSNINSRTIRELIRVAKKQVQYGDIEGARNTFRRTVEITKQVQVESIVFNEIIRFLVELGDSDVAESSLAWISEKHEGVIVSNYNKANALTNIALLQFKKGNKEKAMDTLKKARCSARSISDNYFKIKALIKIAQIILKYSDLKEATDLLDEIKVSIELIKDAYHKARSLIRLTAIQLQRGSKDVVNILFSSIDKLMLLIQKEYSFVRDPKRYRDRAFAALLKVCLQSGNIEGAMKAFYAIRHDHIKITVLLRMMHIVERQIEDNGHLVFSFFLEKVLEVSSI